MLIRLNKYLKDSGLCSRRKADEFIAKGFVCVDGVVVHEMGMKIDPEINHVTVSEKAREEVGTFRYILLYKPVGYVTTKDEGEGRSVFDLLPRVEGLTYAGRLDKDSEGLIIFSNDGKFVYRITDPEKGKEKEYAVSVDRDISDEDLDKMRRGMIIDGKTTRPAKVRRNGSRSYNIILTEGMNRQIRKMAGKVHCNVLNLKRIRIGSVFAKGIGPGEWRDLSEDEIKKFD